MSAAKDPNAPKCGVPTRREGNPPCQNPPILGQRRCRMHGGKHKKTEQMRHEYITNQKIKGVIGRLNITPIEDPLSALKMLAGEAVAWKEQMALLVADLDVVRYRTENAEQIRGEVALFERAMERCASIVGMIAKLNIDERLAAITEQQATILTQALFAAFDEAGLGITDTEQKKAISKAFGRHLRLVA